MSTKQAIAVANAAKKSSTPPKDVTPRPKKSVAARKSAESKAKTSANVERVEKLNDANKSVAGLIDDSTAAGVIARNKAATEESATLKAWSAAGSKTKRPATPNLDAVQAEYEAKERGEPTKRSKSKSTTTRVTPTVQFFVDHHEQPPSHNRLSTLAARVKMTIGDLRAALKKQGVTDPDTTRWEVELNGKTIGARLLTDPPRPPKPKSERKPAEKATAKKTPAKKSSAAKKTTAAKSSTKKSTPTKSAAKRSTTSKRTAA